MRPCASAHCAVIEYVRIQTHSAKRPAVSERSSQGHGDYGCEGQVLHTPLCRAEIVEQRIDYLNALHGFVSSE